MKSKLMCVNALALVVFLTPIFVVADSIDFKNSTYKDAKKAESYIRFDMSSSKLGLITTSFTGYVKNFVLVGEIVEDKVLPGAKVEFSVDQLDTDIGGRNDKMWNYCLNMKEHPNLRITINDELNIDGSTKSKAGTIFLRGYEKPLTLNAKVDRLESGDLVVDFEAELSIKELEIPDPSILVASVKDKIKIKSHLVVNKK